MPTEQSLSWIITLFENEQLLINHNWEHYHNQFWDSSVHVYLCSQLERCPETSRLHWQAFVKYKKPKTLFSLKKIFPKAHFTKVTTERAQAINYGCKEETRVEGPLQNGDPPKPSDLHQKGAEAQKQKWENIRKALKTGDKEAIPVDVVIRYNFEDRWSKLTKWYSEEQRQTTLPSYLPNPWGLLLPVRSIKQRHYWIYSRLPSRGKTTGFLEPLLAEYTGYIKTGDYTYWNVNPETCFIAFDDYNHACLKYDVLNQICDGHYEFRIFRGGLIRLAKPLIIVCSNHSIQDIYPYMYQLLHTRFIEKEIK